MKILVLKRKKNNQNSPTTYTNVRISKDINSCNPYVHMLCKNMENIFKNTKIELLDMKTTVPEVKNTLGGI